MLDEQLDAPIFPQLNFSLEDVEITYKNFSGRATDHTPEGNRTFGIVIRHEDVVNEMFRDGWRLKCIPGSGESHPDVHYLPIHLWYRRLPPYVTMKNNDGNSYLSESEIYILDELDLMYADIDVVGYHWEVNGNRGVKAVLRTLSVAVDE